MFPDYDLRWKDGVPLDKRAAYHRDFAAKSELLGIDYSFHWSTYMDQGFLTALDSWTTRQDQAPDFLFLGNSFTFPDDSDEYQKTFFLHDLEIDRNGIGNCRNVCVVHVQGKLHWIIGKGYASRKTSAGNAGKLQSRCLAQPGAADSSITRQSLYVQQRKIVAHQSLGSTFAPVNISLHIFPCRKHAIKISRWIEKLFVRATWA